MARIPEAEIEQVKRETDLAALVRSRGVELRPHGTKDLAGKCPFHQEESIRVTSKYSTNDLPYSRGYD